MPAGRPVGTQETPFTLIKTDLKETLKQQKRIRTLFDEQLTEIQEDLKRTKPPLKQRLEILRALAEMSETLTKGLQQAAKYVLSAEGVEKGGREGDQLSLEDVLGELEGKRKL